MLRTENSMKKKKCAVKVLLKRDKKFVKWRLDGTWPTDWLQRFYFIHLIYVNDIAIGSIYVVSIMTSNNIIV